VLTLPAVGQSVISTRAGIVYFFEGAVYLADQPLESHPGKFSSLPEGAELRTAEGRAEVLLTPGVFLRIGERSTIRMIANKLSDTRVELLAGSALVDSVEPSSDTSVTLVYRKWRVHFLDRGAYRIDCEPPRLWVFQGKAEVLADSNGGAISVGEGMYMPFAAVLVPERTIDPPRDALSSWAEGRQQSISTDNAIAANIQDPASVQDSASIQDPGSMNTSNSGPSLTLLRNTYLPLFLAAGLAARFIYNASSSSAPHRSFAISPSSRSRSASLLADARSSFPRARFAQPARLFRPTPAEFQLHLAISVRPVSRVGMHRGIHY
jgi:hypothetical protein